MTAPTVTPRLDARLLTLSRRVRFLSREADDLTELTKRARKAYESGTHVLQTGLMSPSPALPDHRKAYTVMDFALFLKSRVFLRVFEASLTAGKAPATSKTSWRCWKAAAK